MSGSIDRASGVIFGSGHARRRRRHKLRGGFEFSAADLAKIRKDKEDTAERRRVAQDAADDAYMERKAAARRRYRERHGGDYDPDDLGGDGRKRRMRGRGIFDVLKETYDDVIEPAATDAVTQYGPVAADRWAAGVERDWDKANRKRIREGRRK